MPDCAACARAGKIDLREDSARPPGRIPVPFAVAFSFRVSAVRQLLDVMDQAVELPLRGDLGSASQGESVQLLVRPQVTEHRFHRSEAPRDHLASVRAVDLVLHPLAGRFLGAGMPAHEYRHVSDLTALRMA